MKVRASMFAKFLICIAAVLIAVNPTAHAQGKARAAKEAAEFLISKFGKEVGKETLESLTGKIERFAIRYGDDAVIAARKIGPRVFSLVDDAGENGAAALKLLAKHGDDAQWVVSKTKRLSFSIKYGDDAALAMIRHREIAEPVIEAAGRSGASALKAVTAQNARRIAMMAEEGTLSKIGRTEELLEIVGKYGDRAMNFVWTNKGGLLTAAALAAFVAEPEPFLDGVKEIVGGVVQPVAQIPLRLAEGAAAGTNWTVVILATIGVVTTFVFVRKRHWFRSRPQAASSSSVDSY